jgi:HSP20 family protein
MRSLIKQSSCPTLFDEPFFGTVNATFRALANDLFSDRGRVLDVFKNQSQYPKTDITETVDGLKFEMAVPGCEKGDVEILLEDGILSVKYDKVSKQETKEEEKTLRSELRRSSFRRSWKIDLEREIKDDAISATMENGILTIHVPYKEIPKVETNTKKIPIS